MLHFTPHAPRKMTKSEPFDPEEDEEEFVCKECEGRRYLEMTYIKLINNPAHLYVLGNPFRDLCPYCRHEYN